MNAPPLRAGRVVLLNGASSSGKSSVARELQSLLPAPHLFAGIDFFLPMLRPDGHMGKVWQQRTNENSGGDEAPVRWVFPDREGEPVKIEFSELGHRLIRGMHRSIAALAQAGNDVIFEHVLLYPEWADDLREALEGIWVTYVGIRCPVEALEERERARADAVVGQARGHCDVVHVNMTYHVEVDTSRMSPNEAAKVIEAYLARGEKGPTAGGRV
jgi:chloramphenicol 3-O phosphotransferase